MKKTSRVRNTLKVCKTIVGRGGRGKGGVRSQESGVQKEGSGSPLVAVFLSLLFSPALSFLLPAFIQYPAAARSG